MSGQFGVDPATLRELAGKFDREATGLAGPIESFAAGASDIGQAFGLLGVCDGAAEKYGQLLSHTVKALGYLPQVLNSDADRLRVNAATYTDSDETAVGYLSAAVRRGAGPA